MTDRPIIFSAPMVRALFDGRKTQTRRIIKDRGDLPQFCGGKYDDRNDPECWGWEDTDAGGWVTLDQFLRYRFVPYAPGDRLWVREAHALVGAVDPQWVLYRAAGYDAECARHGFDQPYPPEPRWRPSIFMPRWASRLTLIVTDVRVERLQEITTADAEREGCEWDCRGEFSREPRELFCDLWNSLHGPDAWDANPWVAAITFDVKRGNIDWLDT